MGVLTETSFYKAMALARGTLSVVDSNGVCWERIWCIFELYHSVASKPKEDYTWDVYTTLLVPVERDVCNLEETSRGASVQKKLAFGAVGFTTGLIAVDFNDTENFKG